MVEREVHNLEAQGSNPCIAHIKKRLILSVILLYNIVYCFMMIPSTQTNMKCMFYHATSFNQPIGSWDTSQVADMRWMFYSATSFGYIISHWVIPEDRHTDWMKGTLLDYYQSRKEDTLVSTKQFKEELIATTWEPKRVVDWCFDGESKEEIEEMD